jgi:hypothetical protein
LAAGPGQQKPARTTPRIPTFRARRVKVWSSDTTHDAAKVDSQAELISTLTKSKESLIDHSAGPNEGT